MIGKTLGVYQIVEQIGSGGMATVFKAYDPGTDRHVAIKVLPETYMHDPIFRERFQREAKAIAKLEHVHILPIFGYGEDADRAYLVMRYMPTGTLADTLKQGALPLEEVSRLLGQIAAALDTAHEQDIIHRDVKPSNILMDKQRNAYLSDFGIAKILEAGDGITGSGIIGTPAYMSPEQCSGEKRITQASDQYSLGVILYQMVTGQCPYEGETPIAIIMQHVNAPLPNPRLLRPDLPEAAAQVIERALQKRPENRFASCSEMAAYFAEAVTGRVQTVTLPAMPAPATMQIALDDYGTIATITDEDIYCPSCATANPPQARKCMNCGMSLGRTCAVCFTDNPPGTERCISCNTSLDRLSAVFSRQGPGRTQSDKILKNELVRSKGEDMAYMLEQRAKLDEEERLRQRDLQAQQAKAAGQQQWIVRLTLLGIVVLVIIGIAIAVINR